jgi:hypothetical protein
VTADGFVRNRAAEPYLDRGRHLERHDARGGRGAPLVRRDRLAWGGDWSGDEDYLHFSPRGT